MNVRLDQPSVDEELEDEELDDFADDEPFEVPAELLQEWERRAADARAGRTRGLSWEEVKAMLDATLREVQERRR